MNILSFSGTFKRLRHRAMFHTRLLDIKTKTSSFSIDNAPNSIQRIYVINLDRKSDRWRQINRELERIRNHSGVALSAITRRFSAIDARYLGKEIDSDILRTYYTLADQLTVEPNPLVDIDAKSRARRIDMTPQEIAIALSHIEVWKLIAASDTPYTLVLEDDAYFRRGFSRVLDKIWRKVINIKSQVSAFDLLYLSFQEVANSSPKKQQPSELIRKPASGIWQASGYVLSRSGAKKLIELLPVYGPIDLWLNLQFEQLDVLVAQHPIIEQRIGDPSTNSYSVMPVLSQIGVHTREKPLVTRRKKLPGPIFAYGEPGSGLTSLAMALSMLGYTCCSDLATLPTQEHEELFKNKRGRRFHAYVNIGSLNHQTLAQIVKIYPNALLIFTTRDDRLTPSFAHNRMLYLPHEQPDKWVELSSFLRCEYPVFPYPVCDDGGQRDIAMDYDNSKFLPSKRLRFDISPWILTPKNWRGVPIVATEGHKRKNKIIAEWNGGTVTDNKFWKLRDDTFPSNSALFTPDNIEINETGITSLILKKQSTSVRLFTSAAVVTRNSFTYGKFSAEIRPSNVSGLITGLFLHRNSPRQEIDIEFLGKDTTKMLINVFYNPGIDGTKLEYGYRGTPIIIELGFDAAESFHTYEIEWCAHVIHWRVDGCTVYKRTLWNPTPIPNLPMEFNVNLWYSRSKELAGSLDISRVPARTEIKSIQISQ